MKRWTREHADEIAKDFSRTRFADAWYLFGSDVRHAILDNLVMDAMRAADVADSRIPLTATEVCDFRRLLQATLAAGVKRRNAPPLRFNVEDL